MQLNHETQTSSKAIECPFCSVQGGDLKTLNVDQDPVRRKCLCFAEVIQGQDLNSGLIDCTWNPKIGGIQPIHGVCTTEVESRKPGDSSYCGIYYPYSVFKAIHSDMSFQNANGLWTRLKSNDPTVWRGPMTKLQNVLAHIGANIQAELARSNILPQKGSHGLLVVLIDQAA